MPRILIEGEPYHIENAAAYLGKPIGVSEWLPVTQERVDQFGAATNDFNPMHVNPEWASAKSPFGGPVAHGFMTLSMFSHLAWSADLQPDGVDYGINLGFERVRFLAPVNVGDSIRLRANLLEVKPRDDDKWWFKTRITIETEISKKAAISAIWIILFVKDAEIGPQMREAIEMSSKNPG
jgi:acyl dehydratase